MKEFYNLPVLYTKEEAKRYAKWGIRKSKLLFPFAVIVIGIDLLVVISTIILCIKYVLNGSFHPHFITIFASKFSYAISTFLTFLVVCPLNILFDFLFQKPPAPMTLRLEPAPHGMLYTLLRKKKVLCTGVLSWNDWPNMIFPETNEILIENQKLKIGRNTIDSIYPKDIQQPWLDRPDERIVGTIRLEQIQKNMIGYLASLESQKKEAKWVNQNRN